MLTVKVQDLIRPSPSVDSTRALRSDANDEKTRILARKTDPEETVA